VARVGGIVLLTHMLLVFEDEILIFHPKEAFPLDQRDPPSGLKRTDVVQIVTLPI